jgi:hypothetical protein
MAMNLRPKRLVRTPYSEQYALFDADRTDDNFDPLSVGKLDIHYTQHGIYGTLLFWEESCKHLPWDDVLRWAELFVADVQAPMGVPGEYAIEFFCPALEQYELLSNIESEEGLSSSGQPAVLSESDGFAEEREPQNDGHDSDWPFPEPSTFSDDDEEYADLDVEGDDSIDDEDGAADFLSRPSRRPGIHGSLEWVDE